MYTAFISFIVPGLSLLLNLWVILLSSFTMTVVFKLMIYKEEQYLENVFGDEYKAYKNRVKQLIPFIHQICRPKAYARRRGKRSAAKKACVFILLILSLFAGCDEDDSDGSYELATKRGTQGTGDGHFDNPHGIAIDLEGAISIYVSEIWNQRIQKFTPAL